METAPYQVNPSTYSSRKSWFNHYCLKQCSENTGLNNVKNTNELMPLLLINEQFLKQENIPVNIFVSVLFWKGPT